MPGVLRVREGDYRVLYTVDDDQSEVWIEDVRPRGKGLSALTSFIWHSTWKSHLGYSKSPKCPASSVRRLVIEATYPL